MAADRVRACWHHPWRLALKQHRGSACPHRLMPANRSEVGPDQRSWRCAPVRVRHQSVHEVVVQQAQVGADGCEGPSHACMQADARAVRTVPCRPCTACCMSVHHAYGCVRCCAQVCRLVCTHACMCPAGAGTAGAREMAAREHAHHAQLQVRVEVVARMRACVHYYCKCMPCRATLCSLHEKCGSMHETKKANGVMAMAVGHAMGPFHVLLTRCHMLQAAGAPRPAGHHTHERHGAHARQQLQEKQQQEQVGPQRCGNAAMCRCGLCRPQQQGGISIHALRSAAL